MNGKANSLKAVDRRTALIADDDEYFRMALKTILQRDLGFAEVIETGSFDEAIERLEAGQDIELALFDLSMPGLDSPSALRIIRDTFSVERLGVVSASEDRGDIILSLEAGAHGFISKGQGVGDLQRALEQILSGTIYLPPSVATLTSPARDASEETAAPLPERQEARLTPRQWDVLEMLVEGKSNKEIARALQLGPGTIKVHLAALFRNLGVSNRAAAAVAGARLLEKAPRAAYGAEGSRSDTED